MPQGVFIGQGAITWRTERRFSAAFSDPLRRLSGKNDNERIGESNMKELPKTYDPKSVEKNIYDLWMKGGYFKGTIDPDKKPFSIVMPPPNVTGQLHMGHALDATLQDILTRYKRMQG